MPKIQTICPQCQQPIIAEIFQVIDVNRNPQLKEVLLAGGLNYGQCQTCGFQGQLPVPLVYHDADKEILLTFSPPGNNKTMEEKEKAFAPLLKDIIDNLVPEKRKGYLFQPKTMLTMNNLVKNVLMGDGITEDMIKQQQEKMSLIDQLLLKDGEQLIKTVRDNNLRIDREFFALFAEIAQRILGSQDDKSITKIQEIQEVLMSESDVGKEILNESQEIEKARQSLEVLGQNLTRESLLELVINSPSGERVKAIAGLVRPAMDYQFFQMFTEMIENTDDEIRNGFIIKRNLLLKVTQEIDQQLEQRLAASRLIIDKIITQDNPDEALLQNLGSIDPFFIQELSSEIEIAEEQKLYDRKTKLENLFNKIQELTTPPELKVLEKLMDVVENEKELNNVMDDIDEELSSQLIDYLTSIIGQYEERLNETSKNDRQEIKETLEKIKLVYIFVLKRSMKMKLRGK